MLPEDANHALLVGKLVGLVMREHVDMGVLEVVICDDEAGNHQTHFEVMLPSGTYVIEVRRQHAEKLA
jgi:hypothetical protein